MMSYKPNLIENILEQLEDVRLCLFVTGMHDRKFPISFECNRVILVSHTTVAALTVLEYYPGKNVDHPSMCFLENETSD